MTGPGRHDGARRVHSGVVLATGLAAVLGGCTSTPEVPLPGRWGDADGLVTLHPDGTGELAGVPVAVGATCDPDTFEPFDGDVAWEETEPGTIHVMAGEAPITLWADRGGFGGDLSWFKVAVGPCGDGTPGADVLTYTRDTTFPSES